MTKRTRYLIMLFGVIAFLILAPAIVLYVRGVSFDFQTKTFVDTGILAVRTDPKFAQIFLDGKLQRTSSGDIRFVLPGEHSVQIKDEGYRPWSKRLVVQAGQVTWANPISGKVYLFLDNPKVKTLAGSADDFYVNSNELVYLKSGSLITTLPFDASGQKVFALPKPAQKILARDDAGANFALGNLASSTLVIFNASSGQVYDASSLFPSSAKIQFGDNGALFVLSNGVLYTSRAPYTAKSALFKNVKAFYWLSGSLYFVQAQSAGASLLISQEDFTDSQVLINNVPDSADESVFASFEKQIFLLSGDSLYLASSGMQKLADNVSQISPDPQNSYLAVNHSGELDYFDFLQNDLNLITRLSDEAASPQVRTAANTAFFSAKNQLTAIELDLRDTQNTYPLYSGTNLQKFFVDGSGKNLWVLDGGEIKYLQVR